MRKKQSRTHIRLWVLMLAAFAIVGGSATIAIVNFTLQKFENDSRIELLSLAKVISLQLKPQDQVRLSRNRLDDYRLENDILVRAQRSAGNIRRIYTFRKRGAVIDHALDTAVDPQKPLPASILSPAPSLDRDAKDVFNSGIADVDEDIVTDKKGPYFTAYAPLVDSTGHVVAVLGIDRDATQITTHIEVMKRAALLALGLVLLLGSVFSLIIVRQLARTAKSEAWLRGATTSNQIFRATILELSLMALAFAVLAIGVYSQIRTGQLRIDENMSLDRSKRLEQYRERIELVLRDFKVGGLGILVEAAGNDGFDWLANTIQAGQRGDSQASKEALWQSLLAIKKKVEDEKAQRERIHSQMGEMNERMTSALILSILLSFGSLILLRSAAKQQQELLIARHDSQRHQVAYEQVATNLPIGFYTYRDGEIQDANAMWDSMVTRLSGEDRLMALERTILEEDLEELTTALKAAQESGTSFQLQFRIRTSSSEIRNYETRGLWVRKPEEGIDNLLGFFVDVTDLVSVQDQLESKNREVQAKNFMLSRALGDLEENFEAMVRGLVRAVEAKDSYTAGHSERVMKYSLLVGEALGLSGQQLRILERGTLVHDVGKIGIPDAILNKPGRLDDDEFNVIKTHPLIGANMIRGIPVFEECLPIVQWHHERLNGAGYPDGLKGDEIPILVRIASVADVFDALTSTRAYRAAMDVDKALAILRKDVDAGILDGKIVELFADIVKREGLFLDKNEQAAA